jgi:hypothetical protein
MRKKWPIDYSLPLATPYFLLGRHVIVYCRLFCGRYQFHVTAASRLVEEVATSSTDIM